MIYSYFFMKTYVVGIHNMRTWKNKKTVETSLEKKKQKHLNWSCGKTVILLGQ